MRKNHKKKEYKAVPAAVEPDAVLDALKDWMLPVQVETRTSLSTADVAERIAKLEAAGRLERHHPSGKLRLRDAPEPVPVAPVATIVATPTPLAPVPRPLPPEVQEQIAFLKARDIHPKEYRDHSSLIEDAKLFGQGMFSFQFVIGPGGTGKSNIYRQADGVNYRETDVTAEGAYEFGYNHVDEPICLSDVREDKLRALTEFLKGFTNTPKPVTVAMLKSAAYLRGRDLPESYETSSPVSLLLNKLPKLDENMIALMTRARVIFFYPTAESCHEYVRAFWLPEHQDIHDAVGQKLRRFPSIGMRKYEQLRQAKEAGLDWRKELEEMVAGRIDPDAPEYRVDFRTVDPALPEPPPEPPDIDPAELSQIAERFRAYDARAKVYERKKTEAQYAKGKELSLIKARKCERWVRWTESEEASRLFCGYAGSTLREFQTFAVRTDDSGEKQKVLSMGYLEARVYLRMRKPAAVGPAHPDCPPVVPKPEKTNAPAPEPVATIVASAAATAAVPVALTPAAPFLEAVIPEPMTAGRDFTVAGESGTVTIRMAREGAGLIQAALRAPEVSEALTQAIIPGQPIRIDVLPMASPPPPSDKLESKSDDPDGNEAMARAVKLLTEGPVAKIGDVIHAAFGVDPERTRKAVDQALDVVRKACDVARVKKRKKLHKALVERMHRIELTFNAAVNPMFPKPKN